MTGRPPREHPPGMRSCARCGQAKPGTAFYISKGRINSWCKDCHKAYYKRRWIEDPDTRLATRRKWLMSKFGITPEQYDAMVEAQQGLCAICGQPPKDGQLLCVDHDHATGVIRGLLCRLHNAGLGAFGDDIGLLERAIEYLAAAA